MSTREMSHGDRLEGVRVAILVALHRRGAFSKRSRADWEEVREEVGADNEVFKEARLLLLDERLVLGGRGEGVYLSVRGRQVASRLASAVGDQLKRSGKTGTEIETFPVFDRPCLREVSNILGDRYYGLGNSEIGELLQECGIEEPPILAHDNRERIGWALEQSQEKESSGGCVQSFIEAAMNPIRYHSDPALFEDRRRKLNHVLSLDGKILGDDGKLRAGERAHTLNEAQQAALREVNRLVDKDAGLDESEKETLKSHVETIARSEAQGDGKAGRLKQLVTKAAPDVGRALRDLAVAVGSEFLQEIVTKPR